MMGRKAFGKQVKKNLASVNFYMIAEGWVKQHYVTFSGFSLMRAGCADVLQLTGMSASAHSLSVLLDNSGEFLAVAQEQEKAIKEYRWNLFLYSGRVV